MLTSKLLSNPARCAVNTSRAMALTDIHSLSKVELKLDEIPLGKNAVIKWRRKPLFIRHRTQAAIHFATNVNLAEFRDPDVQIYEVLKGFGDRGIKLNGQDVSLQDMFKLFQLENKFLINESKLHREMVKLQRSLHPDKYLRSDATSRVVSDKLSAIVNKAYETLRNPYKRALYLLGIRAGMTEIEIEKKLDDMKMDPKFLSDMMDIRERIDCNKGSPTEKLKLSMTLQTDLDDLILATNRDFENGDYDSVLKRLGYMKFLANCHSALADKLNNFGTY